MVTPDIDGKLWHRGTKLGLVYGLIALFIFGMTMTQDPEGPFAWLSNFGPLLILAPFAAASHAYVLGRKESEQKKTVRDSKSTKELQDK